MKHTKILILTLSIFLLSGCIFEKEVTTIIEVENNLTFSYGEKVNLYDIIKIIDGNIIDDNYKLNTEELGNYTINVNYKNSNKKKQIYELKYEVIDEIPPILSVPEHIYIELNSDTQIMNKVFLGDNADRQVSYEIIGDYDMNTIGSYDLEIKAKDDSDNEISKETTLHIIEEQNPTTPSDSLDGIPFDYYIKNYKDDSNLIGIDISYYQKDIDFQKVKNAGVDFVMMRIGYGPNKDGNMVLDNYFEQNYQNAKEAGLLVGVYLYSYATTIEETDLQTNWIKEILQDKPLDLPIAYDWESWNTFYSCNLNFHDLNNLAYRFLYNLNSSGYDVMLYGSKYYLTDIWDIDYYATWLAQYNNTVTYEKNYKMWQLSKSGLVDGVNKLVDINIYYK